MISAWLESEVIASIIWTAHFKPAHLGSMYAVVMDANTLFAVSLLASAAVAHQRDELDVVPHEFQSHPLPLRA